MQKKKGLFVNFCRNRVLYKFAKPILLYGVSLLSLNSHMRLVRIILWSKKPSIGSKQCLIIANTFLLRHLDSPWGHFATDEGSIPWGEGTLLRVVSTNCGWSLRTHVHRPYKPQPRFVHTLIFLAACHYSLQESLCIASW